MVEQCNWHINNEARLQSYIFQGKPQTFEGSANFSLLQL